jgi:hypothetical protein
MMNKPNQKMNNVRYTNGVRLVGAYFLAYAIVGFVYPIATGENLLQTASRKWGFDDGDGDGDDEKKEKRQG